MKYEVKHSEKLIIDAKNITIFIDNLLVTWNSAEKLRKNDLAKKVYFWSEMSFVIQITPFMSLQDLQIINNLIR